MKILHSLSILILPFLFTGHASAETAPKAPNILFLLSDDHSYPYLGICNSPGSENVKTPCLDQLGKEGLVCHRCYTAAPQCVPSRATLMTGKSPVAARMTRFSSPLPRDEVIYPELLRKQANYTTAIIGRSYHLDGSSPKGGEEIQEILTKHKLKTFLERVDLLKSCKDEEVAPVLDGFLENRPKDKPFYVWANFSDPHHVWTTGHDLRPDPATLKLPPQWLDTPEMRSQLADYCAEVNNLDRTVANVLAVLEKHKVTEETLVVFTGDNGAALPRGKGSLHEFGCHVPLIIRWPGKVKPSTTSNTLLSGEDFAPTFLEAAGVAIPPGVTGKSFLPLLLGKEYAPRQYVFTERGPHASTPVAKDISNNAVDYSRAVTAQYFEPCSNGTRLRVFSMIFLQGI